MKQQQFRYLKERISRISVYSHPAIKDLSKSADMKVAERKYKAWEVRNRRYVERQRDKFRKLLSEAREKLYGDDYEAALKLIKKLENLKGPL